ncbi:MAG: phytanoyl-CoA dioxygenase family protein [Caldilineaceae bacterium]|nr:phytanoyl-CoA dioxygenase family protein [Caldilineaceae bacterium]
MANLTQEQLEFYQENGYLILPEAFNADEVRRMQQEADHILELIINASLANDRRSGRLDIRETTPGQHLVRKIQPINDLSLYLAQVSADERLIGPLRQIMGDEPILMEEKLNYKEPLAVPVKGIEVPQANDGFPVHSDWAYYKAQNYPQTILSSAICIDPCTEDSGPLHIWPGTHLEDLEHERMENGLQVLPHLVDFNGGIDVLAPAGSVLIFSSLLIHNSRPNSSGRPRRLMIYSHYPEQAQMGFDVRNGPTRLRESPYEWEYQRMKEEGSYRDQFQKTHSIHPTRS